MINQLWKEKKTKNMSWNLLVESGKKFYQAETAGILVRVYIVGQSEYTVGYKLGTAPEARNGLVYGSFEVAKVRAGELVNKLLKSCAIN